MCGLQLQWFVLAFLLFNSVQSEDACVFANLDYKAIVAGIDGKVESSESLHRDVIDGVLPTLKYKLINATFGGLKDCDVILSQCDTNSKKQSTFQYHIKCPHVTLDAMYEGDGKLSTFLVEGHGKSNMVAVDYVLKLDGVYETIVGQDQKPHPIIKEYTVDTDPQGVVTFKTQNMYHGDKERGILINRFFNENWREMEKMFKTPIINSFMQLFIEHFNAYSKAQ